MSGAKSLLDAAKEMKKTEETVGATSRALTLADVARDEGNAKQPAGITLLDVAWQQQQASEATAADKPALLSSLARQIDAEDNARVAATIVTAATEVKSAQQDAKRAVVTESIEQVAKEEMSAAAVLQSAVTASRPSDHKANSNDEDANDGYSSFEDDEDALKTSARKRQAKVKNKREMPTDEDSDDGTSGDNDDAGPERTTPSDSKESKEFLRAVFRADKSRVRELLDSGDVDADAADQHGWSALHWAASQAHADVLSSLLSRGARVNLVDHMNGWSPLHVAVVREAVGCVTLLLNAGADPTTIDLYGDSPADIANAARGKKRLRLLELLQGRSNRQ